MRIALALFALLALALCASAQTATPPQIPEYLIGIGGGMDAAATPMFHLALPIAKRITDKNYSYTTIEMNTRTASVRTGIARPLASSGPFTLVGLLDGGLAAGTSTEDSLFSGIGGAFSGGAVVLYNLERHIGIPGTYATGTVRITRTTNAAVLPAIVFGVAKSF